MGPPCSANGPGSPLPCMPEGPGAFIFVMEIKYLARDLWRAEWKQCIRKDPPPQLLRFNLSRASLKKKLRPRKSQTQLQGGFALQPSWSLPLLFLWKQGVGRHLVGYGVPRGSRLCHPFPLPSLKRQGFFYTGMRKFLYRKLELPKYQLRNYVSFSDYTLTTR